MRLMMTCSILAAMLATTSAVADDALRSAIAAPDRNPASIARDGARHPYDVLSFLGVKPDSSVAEIFPLTGYWTEILAPYLHDKGHYIAVLGDPAGNDNERYYATFPPALQAKFAAAPSRYGNMRTAALGEHHLDFLPPNSVGMVLTFRNLHTWMGDSDVKPVLAAFHRALKPGGILGIDDHRARPDRTQDPQALDGYVREDYAIALIEKAGFKLVAESEIEQNPRDTTHWPQGVWTLPPTYRLGKVDHAKYQAIGEADNFLLKFRKVP
jgi:predicted methyltransferase